MWPRGVVICITKRYCVIYLNNYAVTIGLALLFIRVDAGRRNKIQSAKTRFNDWWYLRTEEDDSRDTSVVGI